MLETKQKKRYNKPETHRSWKTIHGTEDGCEKRKWFETVRGKRKDFRKFLLEGLLV
jgi:hypothetical protein